jgi:hypothetical protein
MKLFVVQLLYLNRFYLFNTSLFHKFEHFKGSINYYYAMVLFFILATRNDTYLIFFCEHSDQSSY